MSKLITLFFALMLISVAIKADITAHKGIEKSEESIECYACELFVTAIDNYLESNKSISNLEEYAMDACQFLGNYKSLCEAEVPQVLPLVIQYLEKELTSEQICEKLDACSGNSTDKNSIFVSISCPEYEEDDDVDDDIEISACNICEGLLRIVDEYLDQDSTQMKLENMFATECSKFFPQHEQSCQEFSNYLVPKVTEILESTNICTDMSVC